MEKRLKHLLIGLSLTLILAGCFPGTRVYFEPLSQEGKLVLSDPRLIPSIKDQLRFIYEDTEVTMQGSKTGCSLNIRIPEGKAVRFVSKEIEWYIEPEGDRVRMPFIFNYFDPELIEIQILPTEIMKRSYFGASQYGYYWSYVKFFKPHMGHYYIKYPNIEINNKTYHIPEIEFFQREWFGIIPING